MITPKEIPVELWAAQAKGAEGKPNVIQGIAPNTWFSPLQPLPDYAPQNVQGRQWDFPVGYNVLVTPRPLSKISFAALRKVYRQCDIMQTIVNSQKDNLAGQKWSIKFREGSKAEQRKKAETDTRIKELTEFFRKPDRVNPWDTWLRMWLEDLFVIDAPSLYVRRNNVGGLYGLEVMDGGTIALNIDENGRRPQPPSPAYKQILKGVPAISYTTDQLLYSPRNLVTDDVFGRSPIEMTLVTVNAAINRAQFNAYYYTDGNVPDAVAAVPENWTPQQAAQFTDWWDSMYSGNLATRRRVKFIPGKADFTQLKEPELKNVYDDYIARILCHIIGISCQPFISEVNRATAETAKETSDEVGSNGVEQAIKNMADHVIQAPNMFGYDDLEFSFDAQEDTDAKMQAEILGLYVDKGIYTRDMALEKLGEDPAGGICAERTITTASGIVTLDQAIEQNERQFEADALMGGGGIEAGKPSQGNVAAKPDEEKAEKRHVKKKFLCI